MGGHNVSSPGHSVRVGRRLLALLLLARTVAVTAGCAPATGSLGGKCHDNGCNTYCDDGLECDNHSDTCVGSPATINSDPPPCASTDSALCPGVAGTQAWICQGEESPAPFGIFDCAAEGPLRGETLFCCTPHPGCEPRTGTACESPSAAFLCTGSATPEWDAGRSLCASYSLIDVFTGYCCISEGECFGALSGVQCPGAAAPYYCAGSATPAVGDSGVVCAPAESVDGGDAGLRGYCCEH